MALALATLIAFAPVLRNDFINLDDKAYVTENPHVNGGISHDSVIWAFASIVPQDSGIGHWQPLTWLSHL
jgi:hypothetical protein